MRRSSVLKERTVTRLIIAVLMLSISCSVSMAGPRNTVERPLGHDAMYHHLVPEAAALKAAQQFWPNVPLCDDGGYRIRPCSLGGG
jgi:hypothetical protein